MRVALASGEDVPAAVEAVLRWCWTVTGGRRLAHVVSDWCSWAMGSVVVVEPRWLVNHDSSSASTVLGAQGLMWYLTIPRSPER